MEVGHSAGRGSLANEKPAFAEKNIVMADGYSVAKVLDASISLKHFYCQASFGLWNRVELTLGFQASVTGERRSAF